MNKHENTVDFKHVIDVSIWHGYIVFIPLSHQKIVQTNFSSFEPQCPFIRVKYSTYLTNPLKQIDVRLWCFKRTVKKKKSTFRVNIIKGYRINILSLVSHCVTDNSCYDSVPFINKYMVILSFITTADTTKADFNRHNKHLQ